MGIFTLTSITFRTSEILNNNFWLFQLGGLNFSASGKKKKNYLTWSQSFLYFIETILECEKKKFKIIYNSYLPPVKINGIIKV